MNTLILKTAADHPYECKCEECKALWKEIGTEEDGNYGPFSRKELFPERYDPYHEPLEDCPYCGLSCSADFVDVGVGVVRCGPYHCDSCGASEIGPEGDDGRSQLEKKTGWYQGETVSPYANTVNGQIVDHKTAKAAYELGMLDEKVSDCN